MTVQQSFKLFDQFGQYYDWHTPAVHYQHDHLFVIEKIKQVKSNAKLLDVGCGTGFFLQKAQSCGLDPKGLDPSAQMLASAANKVGAERLIQAPMQAIDMFDKFDAITALSWSINYCADQSELTEVLERFYRALKVNGIVIIQTAHAANVVQIQPDFFVDYEQGPAGKDDIVFAYRFWSDKAQQLNAQYQYRCISTDESFNEIHQLNVADAHMLGECAKQVGFTAVRVVNDHQEQPLTDSFSPFVIAYKQ